MVRYLIRHTTRYSYAEDVTLCHNELQMTPASGNGQALQNHVLKIRPEPAVLHERIDYFGNRVTYFSVESEHRLLEISAESSVNVADRFLPEGTGPSWESARRLTRERPDLYEFTIASPHVHVSDRLIEYAALSFGAGRSLIEATFDLTARIHSDFRYAPGSTGIDTTTEEVLLNRRGVCQDFAHLAIGCLRAMGLAARYVSGYVESNHGGASLTGSDASHAWFSVFVPDIGWTDFDPTNRVMARDQHIVVSVGRDYSDIAPVRGIVYGGGATTCEVVVQVTRAI